MTFNSIPFVFFFLIVTTAFFVTPHRYRWGLLSVASCYFYMYWNPWLIFMILFTVSIDFFTCLGMNESTTPMLRRAKLVLSLGANLGILAVFKYSNFFIQTVNDVGAMAHHPFGLALPNLILPIGISFHTFQAMSYTIDVFRGKIPVERHYGHYLLYVLFYPQLVSGPIERASHFLPQLNQVQEFEYRRVLQGFELMLWGFFKKCAIADTLADYVNPVYGDPQLHHGFPLLLGTYFFAFQIYCDFSGYTDIAIGAARVMGFDLRLNFNRPYIASSLAEFWHRWHISLSTWFRDYLYIPLGGNRVSTLRWSFNIMAVFMLSGLWHGASWTYVIWGAIHGGYQLVERAFKKVRGEVAEASPWRRALGIGVTFNVVCLAWIFFRAPSLSTAWYIVTHVGLTSKTAPVSGAQCNLMLAFIALLLFFESRMGDRTVYAWLATLRPWMRWAWASMLLTIIVLQAPDRPTTFIYFQF